MNLYWLLRMVRFPALARQTLSCRLSQALFVLALGPGMPEQARLNEWLHRVVASDEEIRAEIEMQTLNNSKTFQAMKLYFPAQYEAMIAMQIEGYKQGDDTATLMNKGAQFTANVRLENAVNFSKSPAENQRAYIAAMVPILEHLEDKYGFEACNAMAIGGGLALMDSLGGEALAEDPLVLQYMDEMGEIYFAAAAKGAKETATPESPTQEDWSAVLSALASEGMQQAEIDLVLTSDLEGAWAEPLYCAAIRKWLAGISTLPGPEAERIVRAIAAAAASM